jgi:hypothetical protein
MFVENTEVYLLLRSNKNNYVSGCEYYPKYKFSITEKVIGFLLLSLKYSFLLLKIFHTFVTLSYHSLLPFLSPSLVHLVAAPLAFLLFELL